MIFQTGKEGQETQQHLLFAHGTVRWCLFPPASRCWTLYTPLGPDTVTDRQENETKVPVWMTKAGPESLFLGVNMSQLFESTLSVKNIMYQESSHHVNPVYLAKTIHIALLLGEK